MKNFLSSYLGAERDAAEESLLIDSILVLVLDRLVRRWRHLDVSIEYGISGELQISWEKSHFIPIVLCLGRLEDFEGCSLFYKTRQSTSLVLALVVTLHYTLYDTIWLIHF